MKNPGLFISSLLCFLIGACVPQTPQYTSTSTAISILTGTGLLASPTPEITHTQAVDCHPLTLQPTASPQPVFVELDRSDLTLQVGGSAPEPLGNFPVLGANVNALFKRDSLYLMRADGIRRLGLSGCANET